jgi:tellurite resistance protein TerC
VERRARNRTVDHLPIDTPRRLGALALTYKWARRIAIALVGFTVLCVGVAMIVLPGPAFIVIPAGLGILALEFAWAKRWLDEAKTRGTGFMKSFRQRK